MKKIILLSLVFLPILSIAKPSKPISDDERDKNCRMYMELANTVMMQKQNGLPLLF